MLFVASSWAIMHVVIVIVYCMCMHVFIDVSVMDSVLLAATGNVLAIKLNSFSIITHLLVNIITT